MAQKKEYRSAVRSRRLIRQAFMELLQEKSFEKITVTDIVNRADINRSTFYAHYPDVQGLVDALSNELVEEVIALADGLQFQTLLSDPMTIVAKLMRIGMENAEIYRIIGKTSLGLQQIEKIKSILTERVLYSMDLPEQILRDTRFQIQVNFFIGGIINIFQQWIRGTLDCSSDEIAQQLSALIKSSVDLSSVHP